MIMFITRKIIVILAAVCSCIWVDLSIANEPGHVFSIQFENDFFGGGTDKHFTHGTRIEYITRPIKWITDGANKLPWFSSERKINDHKNALKGRASLSIGQNIYTPEDTFTSQLVRDERPYAGWLYLGFGLMANQGTKRYDKVQLEVGVVGSGSLAEDVQTFWHSMFGLHVPEGWDNQLENEPGIVLYYEQARRFEKRDVACDLEFDLIPHFGGTLGNVFTYATAGFIIRLGPDLKEDFGPPRIRPSLPGTGYFRQKKGLNYYFFMGMEGRAIIRNIFLDGNTFSDSHSVDKNPFVGDLQAGLAIQLDRFQLSYTQIFRTKEFKGQDSSDIFGSLNISCQF